MSIFLWLKEKKNKKRLILYYVVSINYFVIISLLQFLWFVSIRSISENAMFYNGLRVLKTGCTGGWWVGCVNLQSLLGSRIRDDVTVLVACRLGSRQSRAVSSLRWSRCLVSLSCRVRIQLRAAHAWWRHGDSTLADFNRVG